MHNAQTSSWCMLLLQNPVSTLALLVADLQLLAPLVSVTLGTRRFCEPVLRAKPVLVTASIYTVLSYVAVLVRPVQSINLLNLYNFGQTFRFQFAGVLAVSTIAYIFVVGGARLLMIWYGRRRLQPT